MGDRSGPGRMTGKMVTNVRVRATALTDLDAIARVRAATGQLREWPDPAYIGHLPPHGRADGPCTNNGSAPSSIRCTRTYECRRQRTDRSSGSPASARSWANRSSNCRAEISPPARSAIPQDARRRSGGGPLPDTAPAPLLPMASPWPPRGAAAGCPSSPCRTGRGTSPGRQAGGHAVSSGACFFRKVPDQRDGSAASA